MMDPLPELAEHRHRLSVSGPAPWGLRWSKHPPDEPWKEARERHHCPNCREPAARLCGQCGLRILLLVTTSPAWVFRRVERVSFHDDRTVLRRVTVDFEIPPAAPVF